MFESRRKYDVNVLTPPEKETLWDTLKEACTHWIAISIGISIYEFCWVGAGFKTFFEPIGIIVALVLATSIAFFLERSNEKTFQSLNEVNDDTLVKVIRSGNVCQVPRKDIVVGDIVLWVREIWNALIRKN